MKLTVENTIDAGLKCRVWVDGVERDRVVECDPKLGYALIIKLDEANGQPVVVEGAVALETITGSVRVEISLA